MKGLRKVIDRQQYGHCQREGDFGGIDGDGRKLHLDGEHALHYTHDALQNCIPETYVILSANVTPIDSV